MFLNDTIGGMTETMVPLGRGVLMLEDAWRVDEDEAQLSGMG